MNNDLMPFTNLAEMRDAVLEALPPETIKTGVAGRGEGTRVRVMEAIRQACSFVCDGLDFNADFPTKLRCDAHAPLLGALAPRRRRHCRRIVAFTAVVANIVVSRESRHA